MPFKFVTVIEPRKLGDVPRYDTPSGQTICEKAKIMAMFANSLIFQSFGCPALFALSWPKFENDLFAVMVVLSCEKPGGDVAARPFFSRTYVSSFCPFSKIPPKMLCTRRISKGGFGV